MHGELSKDMTTATGPQHITVSKLHRLVPDQGTTWLSILYDGYSRLNLFAEIFLEFTQRSGNFDYYYFLTVKVKVDFFNHPNFFPILVTTTTVFDTFFNNGCSFFLCSNQCKGWQYHHLYQNVTGTCNLVHFQLFGFLNSLNAACPPIGTHLSTTLPQTAVIFSKIVRPLLI